MSYFLNRIKVYSLYLYEYLRFGEFSSAINAILFMFTRKSYAKAKMIRTSMGVYETRGKTLDFQYINYAYELDIKHFIEKQNFDAFFDIGACLGEYSVWLGQKGYRCFAFEPVYESYSMIRKYIDLNKVGDKVIVLNYGLGRQHSIEHFELNKTNLGASKRVEEATASTQKFEINALDDVFGSFGLAKDTKILMKIDVEGMEVEMINGAKNFFNYFDQVTLIIEEKLTGGSSIIKTLNTICDFEYGNVDKYNIYAKKLLKNRV